MGEDEKKKKERIQMRKENRKERGEGREKGEMWRVSWSEELNTKKAKRRKERMIAEYGLARAAKALKLTV